MGSLPSLAQTYATLPYCTGFESGSLDASWTSTSTGVGQVLIATTNSPFAGTYHMTMDVSVDNNYATNEAWLHLDLSGETQVELSVQFKDFSDENDTGATGDGIFFSDNSGGAFTEVFHIDPTTYPNNTYSSIILDVDALASTFGLTLNSTFVIKFQQRDNYGITNDGHVYDEISVFVSTTVTRYAIANGNWATTGTWSLTSGGASCCCIPSATSEVHIENTYDVSITSDVDCKDLTIYSGGTLDINGGGDDLTVNNGGTVTINSGGSFTGNAVAATERLKFAAFAGTYALVVNQATGLDVGEIWVESDLTLNISGSGTISLQDDIEFRGDDATVNNDLTGTLALGPDTDANINYGFNVDVTGNAFVNNGTMTVNEGMFWDGDNNTFTNNGTFTASGEIEVRAFTDDGNSITNNGTMTFTNLDHSDGDFVFNNTGTVNMTGDFQSTTAAAHAVNNQAGGIWNWSGTASSSVKLFCDFATNTFNYNNAGAQNIITPQDSYNNLTLSNSGTKTALASFDVELNLTLSGTATLDAATNTTTITLDGTTQQTITGTFSFYTLAINNTFGTAPQIINNNDITITNTLTLTDGVIQSAGTIIIPSAGTSTGTSAASYIDGVVRKSGNTNFVFPIGNGNIWARVEATSISNADAILEAQYFDAPYTDVATIDPASSPGLTNVSTIEYWDISENSGFSRTAILRLYWEDDSRSVITDVADLSIAKFDVSLTPDAWTNVGTGYTGTDNGDGTGNVVSTGSVSFASPITFGSILGNNPLPIELVYFRGNLLPGGILLEWQTASELNNDFFEIEVSTDGEYYFTLANIRGQGTTISITNYEYVDRFPAVGLNYYRLKQVDFNGEFTYSDIISVNNDAPPRLFFSAYPQPASSHLTLQIGNIDKTSEMNLMIYNINGRIIKHIWIDPKTRQLPIDISAYKNGIYLIRLIQADHLYHGRLLILK